MLGDGKVYQINGRARELARTLRDPHKAGSKIGLLEGMWGCNQGYFQACCLAFLALFDPFGVPTRLFLHTPGQFRKCDVFKMPVLESDAKLSWFQ